METYMYGVECSICHEVNPNGRYRSHESRFYICGKHKRQEVDDWQSQPAEHNRKSRRAADLKLINGRRIKPKGVRGQ
jgi:hypothetical protein